MPENPASPSDAGNTVDRRRFIRWLAFAGVGALTVQKADTLKLAWEECHEIGSLVMTRHNTVPSATASQGLRSAYAMFLAAYGFKHVPVSVILAPHFNRHGSVQNCLPPENLWKNILPTLTVVDHLAKELGERVHINSAYRSPQYNATCPGAAKWSQHLRNNALDIQFRSGPAEVVRAARHLRDKGVFKGGVGLYRNFTHIDTRGHNRDW
jgi:Peptidase M15